MITERARAGPQRAFTSEPTILVRPGQPVRVSEPRRASVLLPLALRLTRHGGTLHHSLAARRHFARRESVKNGRGGFNHCEREKKTIYDMALQVL